MKDAEIRCGRCGTTKVEHRLVNFADGPMVGQPVLICPTAVFLDMWKEHPDPRPDLELFGTLETATPKRDSGRPVDREFIMSYDIRLVNPTTKETHHFDESHDLKGGTYAMGGTNEAWLNVTYNYYVHYFRVFGKKSIRTIYGMTAAESIPILEAAIAQLGTDTDPDYWKATEGNARAALVDLLTMARAAPPETVWEGD